jgi:streptogramin lyase
MPIFGFLTLMLAAGCSSSIPHAQQSLQMGMPQSTSPGLIAPAPMAKTQIQPASLMDVRPQSAIQGQNWTQISGSASFVAASPDGSLWALSTAPAGADKFIFHFVNGSWTNISGLASRIAVSPDASTLYAINSGGGAYSYSGGTWTGLGGGCSDITVSSDGTIYVLSNGGSGSDRAIWHNVSGTWSQVPGSGVRIAASWDPNNFTVSGTGTLSANGLYVLNSAGSIYYKNPNNSYVLLPASASAVTPTSIGGVFVLGFPANSNGNNIFYNDLSAAGWNQQSGAGVNISTDSALLWAVGAGGGIFFSPIEITEFSIPTPSAFPAGITSGPDGNLWFTEDASSKIGRVTTGGVFTEFAIPSGSGGPVNIVTGPDNNLWFTEGDVGSTSQIGRITPASGIITQFVTGNVDTQGIAAGPDGNLWYTEIGANKIGRITTSGTVTEFAIPTANSAPYYITAGGDGNLWFTEYTGNKIGRITTSGTITEFTVPTGSSGGTKPFGIAAGADGNLWFTEYNDNKIGRITVTGTITQFTIPSPSAGPHAITAGPDGNLWFSEDSGSVGLVNKIARITTSGTVTEFPIPTSNSQPFGIAAGPDSKVWFVENGGNKVGKITP